jgi:hypothetical protein
MENTMNETAPAIKLPRSPAPKARAPRDNECACVVCDRPVKMDAPVWVLWIHGGGAEAVTAAEGERRNAAGGEASDLGTQPIGPDCLRRHPELKPYARRDGGEGYNL